MNNKRIFAFDSKDEIIAHIRKEKRILIAMGTEKILSQDPKLQEIINGGIGYPDGIGAVLALRRKGIPAVKIRGTELWLNIINAYHREKSFYLLGGTNEIIRLTVEKLKKDYPGIRILGFRNGYFDGVEYAGIKEDIRRKQPDIVFVALGSPKQEYIMSELIKEHPALYMGLGGSFDLYSGKTKKVPRWWDRYFFWEGLYRAFDDFGNVRRWKRQLPATRIIYKILLDRL